MKQVPYDLEHRNREMAGLWRGIKAWSGGKHAELNQRAALLSAIRSGEESEVVAAFSIARHECVQWKGGLALSHDQMSVQLTKYLTTPLPKKNPRDKEEEPVTPSKLAEELGHAHIARRIAREVDKYRSVAGQEADAKLKVDVNRGRSTNERADVARERLRAIQARSTAPAAVAAQQAAADQRQLALKAEEDDASETASYSGEYRPAEVHVGVRSAKSNGARAAKSGGYGGEEQQHTVGIPTKRMGGRYQLPPPAS